MYQSSAIMITLLPKHCRFYVLIFYTNAKRAPCIILYQLVNTKH